MIDNMAIIKIEIIGNKMNIYNLFLILYFLNKLLLLFFFIYTRLKNYINFY